MAVSEASAADSMIERLQTFALGTGGVLAEDQEWGVVVVTDLVVMICAELEGLQGGAAEVKGEVHGGFGMDEDVMMLLCQSAQGAYVLRTVRKSAWLLVVKTLTLSPSEVGMLHGPASKGGFEVPKAQLRTSGFLTDAGGKTVSEYQRLVLDESKAEKAPVRAEQQQAAAEQAARGMAALALGEAGEGQVPGPVQVPEASARGSERSSRKAPSQRREPAPLLSKEDLAESRQAHLSRSISTQGEEQRRVAAVGAVGDAGRRREADPARGHA